MFSKLTATGCYAATVGGFGVGFYGLSESLINHSKTTQVSIDDYRNSASLRNKILKRHSTMKTILNVDMSHAKRY
jgi:hypothetical protein